MHTYKAIITDVNIIDACIVIDI